MATTQTSSFGTLNWSDLLKGFVVAVLSSVLTTVYTSFQSGSLSFDWKAIGLVAGTSGLGYLIKNLLTPSQTVISAS